MVGVHLPQVDALGARRLVDGVCATGHRHRHRVEPRVGRHLNAARAQAGHQDGREAVGAKGDAAKPLGPVPRRVHGGDDGQQRLRGAHVAGGLLAADVLLAGLQRQAQRRASGGVERHTHQATWKRSGELVLGGHETGVRATEHHGHAVALHGAHGDIGTHGGGALDDHHGERVGNHHGQTARGVHALHHGGHVAKHARRSGHGEQGAEQRARQVGVGAPHHHVDADGHRAGLHHGDGLRVAVGVDEEHRGVRLGGAPRHGHGLGGGGALVQQRRVGQRQAREVGYQGLVVEQRLQAPLRDLRLIRGVRRVPGGVLQHVALDDRRGDGVAVPLPDERGHHHVLGGHRAEAGERVTLGHGTRQVEGRIQADGRGHGLVDEGRQRRCSHGIEHHRLLGR